MQPSLTVDGFPGEAGEAVGMLERGPVVIFPPGRTEGHLHPLHPSPAPPPGVPGWGPAPPLTVTGCCCSSGRRGLPSCRGAARAARSCRGILGMVPVLAPMCPQPPEGHANPLPTPDGAVALAATRTPPTLHPPSPCSIPASRGSPSGRSRTPPSRDGVAAPGSPRSPRSLAPSLGLWLQRVTRAGDRACHRHRTHLLFALSLKRGRDGGDKSTWHSRHLCNHPGPLSPRQAVLDPEYPAGNAARGAPTPRSPTPGPGVGDVLPGRTQPCHPQDSVPLPAG